MVLADEINGSRSGGLRDIIGLWSRIIRLWIITAMKQRMEMDRKTSEAISWEVR